MTRGIRLTGLTALAMLAALVLVLQVDYARDVQPLLKAHCLKCHGPEKPKGRLRLDAKGPALKGGLSGTAIVPGKSAESRIADLPSPL